MLICCVLVLVYAVFLQQGDVYICLPMGSNEGDHVSKLHQIQYCTSLGPQQYTCQM